jgi:hypothetical protein
MLDGDVHDGDLHGVLTLSDAHHPVVSADGHESQGNGFVKSLGGYCDGVFDSVHVFDSDAAGTNRHDEMKLSYSLFIRHCKMEYKLRLCRHELDTI